MSDSITTDDRSYEMFGGLMMASSIVFILLYIPVLSVFIGVEFRKIIAYRLLFAVGISDCVQLLVHASTGTAVLLQFDLPYAINKILGALLFSCYCCNMTMYIILSLNHLVFTVFTRWADFACSPTAVVVRFLSSYNFHMRCLEGLCYQ
ncbi:hypothetical protein ANCCAN_14050 [Ancylostoma caninum]|uniref:7TM GPCR serpentine receptor class x (Srx) domain-containing protein n=1 Tax=Ancylostoma caninum TaxID=29170 RepID=A0A368GB78_ANCCA|nr:hypothetical protein ANCCAN_14050 [Ancylostoma caninum]